MAVIPSIQSGNWSDTSTWDNGIVPGPGDTAQAITGHVVTIDQDIEVATLSNTGSGYFLVTGSDALEIKCTSSISIANNTSTPILLFDSSYSAESSTLYTGQVIIPNAGSGVNVQQAILFDSGSSGSCAVYGTVWKAQESTGSGWGSINSVFRSTGGTDLDIYTDIPPKGTTGKNTISIQAEANTTVNITINSGSIINAQNSITIGANTIATINSNIVSTSSQANTALSYTLTQNSASSLTINGNVSATERSNSTGLLYVSGSLPTEGGSNVDIPITINGDIVGGRISPTVYFNISNTLPASKKINFVVNGNVYGSSAATATSASYAVNSLSVSFKLSMVINGDVYVGNGSSRCIRIGKYIDQLPLRIKGDVYDSNPKSSSAMAIESVFPTASDFVEVIIGEQDEESHIYINGGFMPFSMPPLVEDGATVYVHYVTYGINGEMIDTMPSITNDTPGLAPSEVREGVVYDSDDKVGTMVVPDPSDVYAGVPVDHTVGTASIKATDAAAVIGSQISSLSS